MRGVTGTAVPPRHPPHPRHPEVTPPTGPTPKPLLPHSAAVVERIMAAPIRLLLVLTSAAWAYENGEDVALCWVRADAFASPVREDCRSSTIYFLDPPSSIASLMRWLCRRR